MPVIDSWSGWRTRLGLLTGSGVVSKVTQPSVVVGKSPSQCWRSNSSAPLWLYVRPVAHFYTLQELEQLYAAGRITPGGYQQHPVSLYPFQTAEQPLTAEIEVEPTLRCSGNKMRELRVSSSEHALCSRACVKEVSKIGPPHFFVNCSMRWHWLLSMRDGRSKSCTG